MACLLRYVSIIQCCMFSQSVLPFARANNDFVPASGLGLFPGPQHLIYWPVHCKFICLEILYGPDLKSERQDLYTVLSYGNLIF